MGFRLADAYVQISAVGAEAVQRDLANVEKSFEATAKAASSNSRGLGKYFLMGLGVGTAEQIINRVTNAVAGLAKKMGEAAEKGEALGNGIARWAFEVLHVDNAVAQLDRRTAREEQGRKTGATIDDVINQGLRSKGLRGDENFGAHELAAIDAEMNELRFKQELELRNQDSGGYFGERASGVTEFDDEIAAKARQRATAAQRLDETSQIMDEMDRIQRNKPRFTSLEEFGRTVALSAVKDPSQMLDEERNKLLEEIAKRLGFSPPAP